MSRPAVRLPRQVRGLSVRLLLLTMFFVMLAEVLIYVPSIARFRQTFLEDRLTAAHLAALALKATPDNMISKDLEQELLQNAKVRAIVLKRPDRRSLMLMEPMPPEIDAVYDLRDRMPPVLIGDAFMTLAEGARVLRIIGPFPDGTPGSLEVIINERQLRDAMVGYSTNILTLSLVISFFTASLVYFALHFLMVRPMRRLTASMVSFRKAPENTKVVIDDTNRGDEIGTAQRELRRMQEDLRYALRQKEHLAALGAAVSKISHDLRNILSTAQLVSDSLGSVEDPNVRRIAPRLMQALDRAIGLCARTLSYGRADEAPPQLTRFPLCPLLKEVAASAGLPADGRVCLRDLVPPGLEVEADREQLYRALSNLVRNAVDAMPDGGEITTRVERDEGRIGIVIADTGPGLPEKARAHLFEPFTGSVREGGTGLGLAIARELARGHGGDLLLVSSGPGGTVFRLDLPDIGN